MFCKSQGVGLVEINPGGGDEAKPVPNKNQRHDLAGNLTHKLGDQPIDKIDGPNAFSVEFRIKTICENNFDIP